MRGMTIELGGITRNIKRFTPREIIDLASLAHASERKLLIDGMDEAGIHDNLHRAGVIRHHNTRHGTLESLTTHACSLGGATEIVGKAFQRDGIPTELLDAWLEANPPSMWITTAADLIGCLREEASAEGNATTTEGSPAT